jgi:hypothetical protein
MKSRILAWLLILGVAGTVSFGMPKPRKAHYHCLCYEICRKVPASERCGLDLCNGEDPEYRAER